MAEQLDEEQPGERGEFGLRPSDAIEAPAVRLTREGLHRLEDELETLTKVHVPEIVARMRAIREMSSDPLESGEYAQAMDQMAQLRAREAVLRTMIGSAEIPRRRAVPGVVHLGSKVMLAEHRHRETFTIVGSVEADGLRGRLSEDSPLGRSLMGHRVGDNIEWNAPEGVNRARILKVN